MRLLLLLTLLSGYIALAWGACGCPGHPNTYTGIPQPDERGVIDGDILLTPEQQAMAKQPKFRNMIFSNTRRWPGGVVPYKISDWRHKIIKWNIKSALNKLSEKTGGCVRFREKTDADKHYVKIIYGSGCYSGIGMSSRPYQELSLGFGCELHPIVQHEFIHALGFHHEQARPDRDEHILVKWKNIETKHCHNFQKYGRTPPLPYDLKSVMHYGSFAFSCKLTKSTMIDKQGNKIGGALGGVFYPNSLTDLDVAKIKHLYGCK